MENINEDKIDLRRYVAAVKRYKWLYVAALVIMLSGSLFFALTREPKYDVYATMLIEDENGSSGNPLSGLGNMFGLFSVSGFGSMSADNEMVVARSNDVHKMVVKELQLNRKYFIDEGFMQNRTLYDDTPLIVVADDNYFDTVSSGMQFKIELKKNGKADIKAKRGFFTTLYDAKDVELPATIEVDNAKFTLLPTDDYVKGLPMAVKVSLSNNKSAVKMLALSLSVDIFDAKTSAITFGYTDPNLERGKAVLNTLMNKYNEFRLQGKNERNSMGVEFIDEQLAKAYDNLVESEANMENFKAKNNITDMTAELQVMLNATSKLDEGMLAARTQTMMCDLMLKFLTTEESKYSLLPDLSAGEIAGMEIGGVGANGSSVALTNDYNELVLRRMRLLRSAHPDNKALVEVTANIDAMRGAVIESVKQQKDNIASAMDVLEGQYGQFASRLNSAPQLERRYRDLARELEMNNQIYLVLFGQKTDYQMKVASKNVPATVVETAYSNDPASNMSSLKYPVMGLIVALLFPSLFVLYMLWRRKEINHEYDMPLSAKKGGYDTYEDMLALRSCILSTENSKLVPVGYAAGSNKGHVAEAVTGLCRQIAATGRKVVLVDLGDVCGNGGQLDNISDKMPETVKFAGMDYMGYTGKVASDILLNDRFAQVMAGLYDKYDNVVMPFGYGEDAALAIDRLAGDVSIIYMVEGGVTHRKEISKMVKSLHKEQKMKFWIC